MDLVEDKEMGFTFDDKIFQVLWRRGKVQGQRKSICRNVHSNAPPSLYDTSMPLQATVSVPMLEAHMELLARVSQLPYPNERVLAQLVNYIDHAVSVSQTYKIIKDHLKPMLLNIVFPLLCFNDADAQLLQEDPEEYVRKVIRACLVYGLRDCWWIES